MCSLEEIKKSVNIFDQLPDIGIVATDLVGNIVYVNKTLCKITGYSSEELLKQNPRIFKSGNHSEEFYKDLWNSILDGKIFNGTICNKRKDGSKIWEKLTIIPLYNEGRIENFVGIILDTTEERSNKLTLKSLLKSSPDIITIFDKDGTILEILPSIGGSTYPNYYKLINSNIKDIPGIDLGEVDRLKQIFSTFADSEDKKIKTLNTSFPVTGKKTIFETTFTKFNESKTLGVSRDITEKQLTEIELRSILESIPDLIFIFDLDGTYLKTHPPVSSEFIRPDVIGHTVREVWSDVDMRVVEDFYRIVEILQETGVPQTMQYHIDSEDGRQYYEARLSMLSDDLILSVVRNISLSRQIQLLEGFKQSIHNLTESTEKIAAKLNLQEI